MTTRGWWGLLSQSRRSLRDGTKSSRDRGAWEAELKGNSSQEKRMSMKTPSRGSTLRVSRPRSVVPCPQPRANSTTRRMSSTEWTPTSWRRPRSTMLSTDTKDPSQVESTPQTLLIKRDSVQLKVWTRLRGRKCQISMLRLSLMGFPWRRSRRRRALMWLTSTTARWTTRRRWPRYSLWLNSKEDWNNFRRCGGHIK